MFPFCPLLTMAANRLLFHFLTGQSITLKVYYIMVRVFKKKTMFKIQGEKVGVKSVVLS